MIVFKPKPNQAARTEKINTGIKRGNWETLRDLQRHSDTFRNPQRPSENFRVEIRKVSEKQTSEATLIVSHRNMLHLLQDLRLGLIRDYRKPGRVG